MSSSGSEKKFARILHAHRR